MDAARHEGVERCKNDSEQHWTAARRSPLLLRLGTTRTGFHVGRTPMRAILMIERIAQVRTEVYRRATPGASQRRRCLMEDRIRQGTPFATSTHTRHEEHR